MRLLKAPTAPTSTRGAGLSLPWPLPSLPHRLLPPGLCTRHVCWKPSLLSDPCGLLTLSGLCLALSFLREDTVDRLTRNSGLSAPPPAPAQAASTASAAWHAPRESSLHEAHPALRATRGGEQAEGPEWPDVPAHLESHFLLAPSPWQSLLAVCHGLAACSSLACGHMLPSHTVCADSRGLGVCRQEVSCGWTPGNSMDLPSRPLVCPE